MSRYLIFQTLEDVETANAVIFSFGAQIALAAGQVVTEAGIFGVRDGVPVSDGAAANKWATPILLNDDTYALLHPIELGLRDWPLYEDQLMAALPPHTVVVEPYVKDRIPD
jgi:hypothetical protein